MSTFITKRARITGFKKVDAKKPLQIEVSPRDVNDASKKDHGNCAFARACVRSKVADAAYFFRSTAWLEKDGVLTRYILPPSMQKEIVAFDRNKTMEPGDYQLSPPSKSTTMKEINKRSAKRPGRHQPGDGKIKRRFVHKTQNVRGLEIP